MARADDVGAWSSEAGVGLLLTMAIGLVLAVVALVVWEVIRSVFRWHSQPRSLYDNVWNRPLSERVPWWPGAWLVHAFRHSDKHILKKRGLSAMMHLEWKRMMLTMFLLLALVNNALVLPVNLTGGNNTLASSNTEYTVGLEQTTMANVHSGSQRLWAHTVSVVLNTVIVLGCLTVAFWAYERRLLAARRLPRPASYVVMVSNVPKKHAGEPAVQEFMERLFPGQVLSVQRSGGSLALWWRSRQKTSAVKALEGAERRRDAGGSKVPSKRELLHAQLCCLRRSSWTPDEEFYAEQVEMLNGKVEAAQDKVRNKTFANATYFVTMRTRAAALAATQMRTGRRLDSWTIEEAPEATDVSWGGTNVGYWQGQVRTLLVYAAMVVLVLLGTTPVAVFLAAIANLETLSRDTEALSWLPWDDIPLVVRGLITAIVPSVALAVYMIIFEVVIRKMQALRGMRRDSDVERAFGVVYYFFMVYTVVIAYAVAGNIWAIIGRLASTADASEVLNLIAASLPTQAIFYANYLTTAALLGIGLYSLLRPIPLVIGFIKRLLARSPRKRLAVETAPVFSPGATHATDLLIATISLLYSTMAPGLLFMTLVYFLLAYAFHRYNAIYVFRQPAADETLFPVFAHLVVLVLVAYQALMFAEFLLKLFAPGPIICAVVLLLTVLYWYVLLFRHYGASTRALPLEVVVDANDHENSALDAQPPPKSLYCPPRMRPEIAHGRMIVPDLYTLIEQENENEKAANATAAGADADANAADSDSSATTTTDHDDNSSDANEHTELRGRSAAAAAAAAASPPTTATATSTGADDDEADDDDGSSSSSSSSSSNASASASSYSSTHSATH